MTRRKYKNPRFQQVYNKLVEYGSPEKLIEKGIFGAYLAAFRQGYTGGLRYRGIGRDCITWPCYYAGVDSKKKEKL